MLSVLGIVSWGDFLLFANFWYTIADPIFVDDNCGHVSVKATNYQLLSFGFYFPWIAGKGGGDGMWSIPPYSVEDIL